jgi:Transposase and inactivated derivatives
MNTFLKMLSEKYAEDIIILVCDGAAWHKANHLEVPENIQIVFIPPYTPEMNPIEQIWREIRSKGFRNQIFNSLNDVVDRLCHTICHLSHSTVKHICFRKWMHGAV